MMVNQVNNNSVPWPSTIPDQMPWLNTSACPPEAPMQFVGQQTFDKPAAQLLSTLSPTCQSQIPQSNVDTQATMPSTSTLSPPRPKTPVSNLMMQNPFYPQQAGAVVSPIVGPCLDSIATTSSTNQSTFGLVGQELGQPINFGATLTQIPPQPMPNIEPNDQTLNHKRSSFEMEDELTTQEAPPTKQQLSENKLFQRFGSLHLSNEFNSRDTAEEIECDSDSDAELDPKPSSSSAEPNDRKEFNRYVYLLFKDKKLNGQYPTISNSAVDRLIREDREKLSKAVILWNPMPKEWEIKDYSTDEDEEEFTCYTNDFFKASKSSVVITEVGDDGDPIDVDPTSIEPDDVMLE